jgi:hypothetical protein
MKTIIITAWGIAPRQESQSQADNPRKTPSAAYPRTKLEFAKGDLQAKKIWIEVLAC